MSNLQTYLESSAITSADIRYDLALEMLVTSDRNFSLAVTNMPPQINCSFSVTL